MALKLSEPCRNWAFARSASLTEQAKLMDRQKWELMGPKTDIFDYLEAKLVDNLQQTRQIRQAGWDWAVYLNIAPHVNPSPNLGFEQEAKKTEPRVRRGMIWTDGCSERAACEVYDGRAEYGADWWPVIFMVAEGVATTSAQKVPFYCPALAWNKSRPWYCSLSRVYEIVPEEPVNALAESTVEPTSWWSDSASTVAPSSALPDVADESVPEGEADAAEVPMPGAPAPGVPTPGVHMPGVPMPRVPTTPGVPTLGAPTTSGVPMPGVPTPGVPGIQTAPTAGVNRWSRQKQNNQETGSTVAPAEVN